MPISNVSVDGKVFPDSGSARAHGRGGIWYHWKDGAEHIFPQNVATVMICMPVNWGDPNAWPDFLVAQWTVDRKNRCGAQWKLSGTYEKPTLSPSLNWVDVWHGWLRDGRLISC